MGTGVNTGVAAAKTWSPAMPATYGKTCAPHDETNCKAWWSADSGVWSTLDAKNSWCCKSWAYVEEACPGSEEGMAHLSYSYEVCNDLPSVASNQRVWNGNACVASGGRRLENEDFPEGELRANSASETREEADEDLDDLDDLDDDEEQAKERSLESEEEDEEEDGHEDAEDRSSESEEEDDE